MTKFDIINKLEKLEIVIWNLSEKMNEELSEDSVKYISSSLSHILSLLLEDK